MVPTRRQSSSTEAGRVLKRARLDPTGTSRDDAGPCEGEYEDEPQLREASSSEPQRTTQWNMVVAYGTNREDTPSSDLRKANQRSTWKSAKAKGKAPARPTRRGKDLSLLATVPLDVLFEILGRLGPNDLLSLSQTNKLWRSTVMSPKTVFLWRNIRIAYRAPDPPEDFTEPRWARLLFETSCQVCDSKKGSAVDWRLLRRFCNRCKRDHLVYKSNFKAIFPGEGMYEDVLTYVPHTYRGLTTKGHRKKSMFYWDEDIDGALEKMKTLRGQELAEWKLDALKRIKERDTAVKTYEEWSLHMTKLSISDLEENREKRLEAITQRFLREGYELVDIKETFNANSPSIHSGAPYITNAVWTRLRPDLEMRLIRTRNHRLDKELRPVIDQRMAILRELYQIHLDRTVRPSERNYLPLTVDVFRHHPDFERLIVADKDRVMTSQDFEPLVNNFDRYLTEYQDKKKNSLAGLVPSDKRGTNTEISCDLARHVFLRVDPQENVLWMLYHRKAREISNDVLVGWPMIATHYHSGSSGLHPGVFLTTPARFGYNANASRVSSDLISLAGLEPGTATVDDMDARDPRFVAKNFETAAGYPVFTWRSALGVASALQHESLYSPTEECDFRLASNKEDAEAKENEESLRAQAIAWSCNHCPRHNLLPDIALTRPCVIEHLRTVHDILDPNQGDDYFVNERCRHTYEAPYEIVVPDVQKYKCLGVSCTCKRLEYRRFTKEKIVAHVQEWSGRPSGEQLEGIQYVSVPSGRDAPASHPAES